MKFLPYLICLLLLSVFTNQINLYSNQPNIYNVTSVKSQSYFEDSLKKNDFNCSKILIAETPTSIKDLKKQIAKNKSFVLLYQKDFKWIVEEDMQIALSIINSSESSKILYCEDKIVISGKPYPNLKYAVIIQ